MGPASHAHRDEPSDARRVVTSSKSRAASAAQRRVIRKETSGLRRRIAARRNSLPRAYHLCVNNVPRGDRFAAAWVKPPFRALLFARGLSSSAAAKELRLRAPWSTLRSEGGSGGQCRGRTAKGSPGMTRRCGNATTCPPPRGVFALPRCFPRRVSRLVYLAASHPGAARTPARHIWGSRTPTRAARPRRDRLRGSPASL